MRHTLWMVFAVTVIASTLSVVSPGARAAGHSHRRHGLDDVTTTTTTEPGGSTTTTTLPPCAGQFAPVDSALGALINEIDAETLNPRLASSLTHFTDDVQRLEDGASQAACDHKNHKSASLLKAAIRTMIAFEFRVRSLAGRHGGADASKLLALADAVLSALRSLKGAL